MAREAVGAMSRSCCTTATPDKSESIPAAQGHKTPGTAPSKCRFRFQTIKGAAMHSLDEMLRYQAMRDGRAEVYRRRAMELVNLIAEAKGDERLCRRLIDLTKQYLGMADGLDGASRGASNSNGHDGARAG